METIQQLQAKKESLGCLSGIDAVHYLEYVSSLDSLGWTKEVEEELTAFMLGLPTRPGYRFEMIAGSAPVVNLEPQQSTKHIERTCLGCGHRFTTRRKTQEFHSNKCHARTTERFMAKGIIPTGWKTCAVCTGPFKPETGNEKYCQRSVCQRGAAQNAAKAQAEVAAIAERSPKTPRLAWVSERSYPETR